jgi:hypothetical protein
VNENFFTLICSPYSGLLDAVTNAIYRNDLGNEVASFDYKHDVLGFITQKVSVVDGAAITNSYVLII